VVIPAYNASDTIETVVKRALKFCPVIVADDGSDDDTAVRARQAGADVIRIQKNSGKGNALKLLFKRAMQQQYDAVITLDADGQHDPDEIPKFLKEYERSGDCIIAGSRMRYRSLIPEKRYNAMRIAGFYISLASNQFVEDSQCGFRLYPLKIIERLNLFTEGYMTESEIYMKAGDSGHIIKFIPIKAIYDNNKSHFHPVKDIAMITSFVMLYLIIKWTIEIFCIKKSYTYNKDGLHDLIARNKIVFIFLNILAVLASIPFSFVSLVFFLMGDIFKIENLYSIRKRGIHFSKITIATFMLLLVLPFAIINKVLTIFSTKLNLLKVFIETFYPEIN